MKYVKWRSWHVWSMTSRGGHFKTRCGRWVAYNAPTSDVLPLEEKSCETCLRLVAK